MYKKTRKEVQKDAFSGDIRILKFHTGNIYTHIHLNGTSLSFTYTCLQLNLICPKHRTVLAYTLIVYL